jgi:hypothetical protein
MGEGFIYDDVDDDNPDDFEFDFEEEEFSDYPSFKEKHPDSKWFGDKKYFDEYKNKHESPFKVRTNKTSNEKFGSFDDNEWTDEKNNRLELPKNPKRRSLRHPDIDSKHAGRLEDMIEGIFTESKVDKIIEGYFKIDEKEQKLIESKKRQSKLITER